MTAARKPVSPRRKALLAKTAIAVKELKLDDETFRDLLEAQFGCRTRTALSEAQLVDLVEHLKRQGWKDRPSRFAVTTKPNRPEHAKIRALWIAGWHLGVVRDPSEGALRAFSKRVTGGSKTAGRSGIDRIEWLDGDAAWQVIEALKDWLARDGAVAWSTWGDGTWFDPDRGEVVPRPQPMSDRLQVVAAQWRRLGDLGQTKVAGIDGCSGFAVRHLGGAWRGVEQLTAGELDELIRALGAWIRRVLEQRGAP